MADYDTGPPGRVRVQVQKQEEERGETTLKRLEASLYCEETVREREEGRSGVVSSQYHERTRASTTKTAVLMLVIASHPSFTLVLRLNFCLVRLCSMSLYF